MSISQAQLELKHLIQQFEAARPRVIPAGRNDYDKRLKKLQAELSRLENYDPDIDLETPQELAESVLGIAERLRVFLPEDQTIETLSFTLPSSSDLQATMQAQWDGTRWTLTPQRLAVHDVQLLAGHLGIQVSQTNDLDLWRASILPVELNPPTWNALRHTPILLGGEQ